MEFFAVDAFTTTLFKGNPAAICIVNEFPDEDFMQNTAAEINLSETAFVLLLDENHFHIRWFTPKVEVSLCGHATLAAAHVLWTEFKLESNEIFFQCKSGEFRTWRDEHGITLDFPAHYVRPLDNYDGLAAALGVTPTAVGVSTGDWVVELKNAQEVIELSPNIALLAELDCRAVMVTARGDADSTYDFVSRFFAPKEGVPEDPVTGSAHCKLTTYWSDRLNKSVLSAFQASARGGTLKVEHKGDRVLLTGHAVTVYSAKFVAAH